MVEIVGGTGHAAAIQGFCLGFWVCFLDPRVARENRLRLRDKTPEGLPMAARGVGLDSSAHIIISELYASMCQNGGTPNMVVLLLVSLYARQKSTLKKDEP